MSAEAFIYGATACLAAGTTLITKIGVLTSTADANIGSILGIGFPRWTGGSAQYIVGSDRHRFDYSEMFSAAARGRGRPSCAPARGAAACAG